MKGRLEKSFVKTSSLISVSDMLESAVMLLEVGLGRCVRKLLTIEDLDHQLSLLVSSGLPNVGLLLRTTTKRL